MVFGYCFTVAQDNLYQYNIHFFQNLLQMKIDLFTSSNENMKELFVKHGYLIPSNNFITQTLSEIQTELENVSAILNVPFLEIQIAQNLQTHDSNIESVVDEHLIMEPPQNEYSAPLFLSSNPDGNLEENCISDNQEVLQICENRVGDRTEESESFKPDECISQGYEDETETSANSKLHSEDILDSFASGFSLDSIDALEEVSLYESEEGNETYNSSVAESKSEDYAYDGHEEIRESSQQNIPSIVIEDIDSEQWSSKSMLSATDSQASEAEQELSYMLAAIDCLYYNSQDTTETAAEKLEKLKVCFLL